MKSALTVQRLFEATRERCSLTWAGGQAAAYTPLKPQAGQSTLPTLIGHLNLVQPNSVQVLGGAELAYVEARSHHPDDFTLAEIFNSATNAVVVTDSLDTPAAFVQLADQNQVPLFRSSLASHELISRLRYYLARELAERITLHGVFMEVISVGVLILGESSVGKSELALELISRGHRLVADDAPEFTRLGPEFLEGSCPAVLQNFLEVRGLGILNIRAMYGDAAIKHEKQLKLVIRLVPLTEEIERNLDRIRGVSHKQKLLGVDVTETTLPVAPGRNLAVMVEAAVRNFLLVEEGYNAANDMIDRQSRLLEPKSGG